MTTHFTVCVYCDSKYAIQALQIIGLQKCKLVIINCIVLSIIVYFFPFFRLVANMLQVIENSFHYCMQQTLIPFLPLNPTCGHPTIISALNISFYNCRSPRLILWTFFLLMRTFAVHPKHQLVSAERTWFTQSDSGLSLINMLLISTSKAHRSDDINHTHW